MSQYSSEPYPTGPAAPAEHRPARPDSVANAVRLIWVNVALSVLSAVLVFAFIDDIIDTAIDRSNSPLSRGEARAVVIFGVLIAVVISVALAALWAHFIGKGANWARIVYTVLGVLAVLSGLRDVGDQPGLLVGLDVLSTLLTVAVIVLLFLPASNAFFRKR